MPYIPTRSKTVLPGDPRHGTRWSTPAERRAASRALYELETERNVIGFVPAPSQNFVGHKIRVQESANPKWYRVFGAGYWRSRRSFQLKRARVVRALKRVAVVGIVRRNGYETKLLDLLMEREEVGAHEFA
jgi:hypothetical protein